MGASVIKIEAPEGDGLRSNRGFLAWNRGKRGLGLDLKRPEAREILYRLVEEADVFLENMRPGVVERLGIDEQSLRARNPRLIYCSVTAYGPTGPYQQRPGFDPLLQARSGLERAQGGFQNPPVFLLVPATDNTCAMLNGAGIALALYERERSGRGQRVETSLLRAACLLQSDSLVDYEDRPPRPANDLDQVGPSIFYRLYRCHDGWLFLDARDSGSQTRLSEVTGIDCSGVAARGTGRTPTPLELELGTQLSAAFVEHPLATWLQRLEQTGIPAIEAVGDYARQFADDPLLTYEDLVVHYNHPVYGRVRQPARLARVGPTPETTSWPAPLIGQHTRSILAEAGYDSTTISRFVDQGIAIEQVPTETLLGKDR
jgi:crotonobetainyl-CoA:carnitine CoA-transferase CaiB-like acyl-CoA transferase